MCLGVPGKVLSISTDELGFAQGKVSFGGVVKQVSLACVPEVQPGEYVIVHVGFAISKVDEEEAQQIFAYLREMDELAELDIEQPQMPNAGTNSAAGPL
jgi:hydrogenase expression/formation protein HypC